MAQRVKNLPARQQTWVLSLGGEEPLEKGVATHSSILAWRIPWTYSLMATLHGIARTWTQPIHSSNKDCALVHTVYENLGKNQTPGQTVLPWWPGAQ